MMDNVKQQQQQQQSYNWHPQESKLWLLLFLLITGIRIFVYSTLLPSLRNNRQFRPIKECTSTDQVRATTEHLCSLEIELLCPAPYLTDCVDEFGYSLNPFLFVFPISDNYWRKGHKCTLTHQNPNIYFEFSDDRTLEEREKIILVRVMMSSIQRLYLLLENESVEIQHRFIDFFFNSFFCHFGYTQVHIPSDDKQWSFESRKRVFDSDPSLWTPQEFFRLLNLATEGVSASLLGEFHDIREIDNKILSGTIRDNSTIAVTMAFNATSLPTIVPQKEYQYALYFINLILQVQETLQGLVFESKNNGESVCRVPTSTNIEHNLYSYLLSSWGLNSCITQYYYGEKTVLRDSCAQALKQASHKIRELDLEDGEFLFFSHLLFFGVNLVSCVLLVALLNSKRRLERKMDRGRQRLEKELNDPFLRKVLEYNAKTLPEEEGHNLIPGLEARIGSWNSKEASTKLLYRYLRYFRWMIILTMLLTTIAYLLLHIFHVSSMVRYLEIMAMSTGMMTLSYMRPKGISDEEKNEIFLPSKEIVHDVMILSSMDLDPSVIQKQDLDISDEDVDTTEANNDLDT